VAAGTPTEVLMTGEFFDTAGCSVEVVDEASRLVIKASGEIDYEAQKQLDAVFAKVAAHEPCDVVVDLGETTFVDSVGLGFLVRLHNQVTRLGQRMTVVSTSRQIRRTFGLTGLDRVLTISPQQASHA
jgi:anti-anti-sigma factor